MSDKSSILRAFNTHFFDFINDIIGIFPEKVEIVTARNTFEMAKKANPTIIIKIWHNMIYVPYSSVIEAGDITFFFEKDYGEDLASFPNSGEILKKIDALRDPIKCMSDVNRAHSMKYIQNLSKLSDVYSKF